MANDDIEREGVYLHMARVELNSGQFDEARRHINLVTNQMYNVLKSRLARNLKEKESPGKIGTANSAATSGPNASVLTEKGDAAPQTVPEKR